MHVPFPLVLQIKCDLEEMRAKFIPDFNLQEELEKGLMTEERSPGKPKPK